MASIASLIGTITPSGIIADCLAYDMVSEFDVLHDHAEEMRTLNYTIISAIARLLPERFLLRESDDGQSWAVLSPVKITGEEVAAYADVTSDDYELGQRIEIGDMIREAIRAAKNADQV